MDPDERGVVVIPQDEFWNVYNMLPNMKQADDKVVEAVEEGSTVQKAFEMFRGK